ncbi:3-carboxy-cis,cis-muconate cycloisomerase [Franconibacter daqui]|uniref:3-carboxy-cis,cis-muconate cycloisomerase n=1 Tax=Franconibacter daqui TaxID=2047724 RepID=UPI00166B6BD4|nr:3-carboxy-cis,cis-muconate cycloisomerase [Franconibacter daqui]GGD15415.1 3-carboxy-cis,cis-muconate cycloisomerase [Franconibacter daqui]
MKLLTPLLRPSRLTPLFSDEATLQRMLDVEASLAQAQAQCGIVPAQAAAVIADHCKVAQLDLGALAQATAGAGNLAIPLVKQLTACVKAADDEAARYVHWGATSQDIIDSGLMLQLRDAFTETEALLKDLLAALAQQTARHQQTVMAGRTWLQHALPTTFGLKLAGTLDALLRWQERLKEIRPRALAAQFGGAAGTLASLEEKGPQVAQALASALSLSLPDTPWHSQRDRLLEVGGWYAGVAATLGKFASDFALLMQTEVGEAAEPVAQGRGGSSAMPHKRNPVACAAILTATTRLPGLMATLYASQLQQHERALGGWQAEWETLPDIITLAGGVMQTSLELIRDMQVFPEKMRENLHITHGLIMAEPVTLKLAEHIGKQAAHQHLEPLCHRSLDEGVALQTLLVDDALIRRYFSEDEIARLLSPLEATGSAPVFIRQVLARYKESL